MFDFILWLAQRKYILFSEGGLFDFDFTLFVNVFQLLIFIYFLNIIFYKPIGKILDERNSFIASNLKEAEASLLEAQELTILYDKKLVDTRKEAFNLITSSKAEIQQFINDKSEKTISLMNEKLQNSENELAGYSKQMSTALEQKVPLFSEKILVKFF
uniref:ATP synthase CF0 B' subunit n=1 Tax=Gloeochaete wittrockiana TaxID=38269 RepID=A0A3G1IVX0_9EUKA|nr:ATP synthase CF0 B' subunit [Gloeochaete wittrockiana]ASQ40182.1 ATP synthase CF0 B' subunit [Gloeochaete wittrockiana]